MCLAEHSGSLQNISICRRTRADLSSVCVSEKNERKREVQDERRKRRIERRKKERERERVCLHVSVRDAVSLCEKILSSAFSLYSFL